MKLVLGIDPGTIRTGFAIVSVEKDKFSVVKFGVLSALAKQSLEQRLLSIGKKIENIYKQYSISETAIEQIFFGKNPDSAFKLGHIFGVCVYHAMCSGSLVFPYAARYIKKSVTGSGSADKQAVQTFVLNIFGIPPNKLMTDSTDALAVALCHIYQKQNPQLQSVSSSAQIEIGNRK